MRYEEQRARNETIAVSERARASDRASERDEMACCGGADATDRGRGRGVRRVAQGESSEYVGE